MSQHEPAPRPANGERLTMEEIERRYPDEWVALVDDDFHENNMVLSRGVVFAHSLDRNLLLEQTRHLRSAAILYTGTRGRLPMRALGHVARKL